LCQSLEHGRIFSGFVESLIHVFQVGRVDGLHADEDPFAPGVGNEVYKFFIAE